MLIKRLAAFLLFLLFLSVLHLPAMAATTLFDKTSSSDATGSTNEVAESSLINNVIQYSNNDTGIISDVRLTDDATNQTIVGTPQAITGWNLENQTSSHFEFSADLVPPDGQGLVFDTSVLAGTISGASGGGDGFVPLFADDGNIYWVFHHLQSTIQCANPETGQICPGYPVAFTFNVGGQNRRGWNSSSGHQATIVGDRMFFATALINGTTATYDYGLGCFDLAARAECADNPFQIFGQFPATLYSATYSVINAAEYLIGDNLYMTDYSQKVWCYDVVNTPMTACPGYPKDLANPASFPVRNFLEWDTLVQEGTRLFRLEYYPTVATNPAGAGMYVKCYDTATDSECAGWGTDGKLISTGTATSNGVYGGFVRFNTSLQPDGICTRPYNQGTAFGCVSWADGSQLAETGTTKGIPNGMVNKINLIANAGHRPGSNRSYLSAYTVGGGVNNKELCWDWSTNDACKVATPNSTNDLNQIDTAPGDGYFGDGGYLRHPANSTTHDYGARFDAKTGCWWALGDANILWSFDDDGNTPCIPQAVRDQTTLSIPSAYCSSGLPGDARWTFARVTNFNPAHWNRFVVEVKDPAGNVLASFDANSGPTSLDISAINAQTIPELSYFIYATITPGQTPYANQATTPLVSIEFDSASPIEFCYQSTAGEYTCEGLDNITTNQADISVAGVPSAQTTTSLNLTPDPVGKCADMSLAQTAVDPVSGNPITTYTPGTNLDWQLFATNEADTPGTNIVVSTTFPPGVTPELAGGDGWTCTISGQDVTCTRPSVDANETAPPITISTYIASNITGSITNTATVGSDNSDDPTPANNIAPASVTAEPQADLTIAKRHDVTPVAGGTFNYSFDVFNNGPSDTPSFTVSDTLDASLTFVTSGSSPECSAVGQIVTCNGGPIASGAFTTLHIVVAVSPSHQGGAIPNTATVSGPVTDPTPGNNSSDDNVDPSLEADLAVQKILTDDAEAGGQATYQIIVTNNGISAASGITITDPLPVGLTFLSVASSGPWNCTPVGSSLSCIYEESLAPQDSTALNLTVQVDANFSGELTNTARVTATTFDPILANNFAVAAAQVEPPPTNGGNPGTGGTGPNGLAQTGFSPAWLVVASSSVILLALGLDSSRTRRLKTNISGKNSF